ncbi:hypothetical protein ACQ4M3_30675 [Leptolyngbya sp. AN03gr2]|uniref:hypothetical protein n=1 Tax=unclassified Leptolyngbya TaxID=2650499 RepID=UPI003D317D67
MNQNSSQSSIVPANDREFSANELDEVNRLLNYIKQTAIDSENTPIHDTEILIVANLVIKRIVWKQENLQQVIQEALDDLRFGA